MELRVFNSAEAACEAAGTVIAAQIIGKNDSVLGLATGSTPIPVYDRLVSLYDRGIISFERIRTFNLDEYIGLDEVNPMSYHAFMHEHLFDRVDIHPENTHIPGGMSAFQGKAYDDLIGKAGGIDLQLLGIGRNGHIGFNEPSESFITETHTVALSEDTIQANARFFSCAGEVPKQAITMGIGSIMRARCILLIATGRNKAEAIRMMLQGPVTPKVPASVLQLHPRCIVFADRDAAGLITD